jgi:thioesterase domain-containing protein
VLGHPLRLTREEIQWRPPAEQRGILHARLVAEGLMPAGSDADVLVGPLRTYAAAIRARYIPSRPYAGPAQLVVVSDPRVDQAANQRNLWKVLSGWRSVIPGLSWTHAPGNHMTILKAPHVQLLATIIQRQSAGVAVSPLATVPHA